MQDQRREAVIVEVDFLKHWKTQMLIGELDDKCAPLYLLALWTHCQIRKSDVIPGNPSAIKAICGYDGDAERLKASLLACQFLDETENGLVVHGWSECNAKLIANWENGKKGGRQKTQPEPTGNPNRDWDNPTVTDRGDREEKIDKKKAAPSERGMKFAQWFKTLLPPDTNLTPSTLTSWATCFDEMIRIDNRTEDEIAKICKWARKDEFWRNNFYSPCKLRDRKGGVQQFDTFKMKMPASSFPKPKPQQPTIDTEKYLAWLDAQDYAQMKPEWRDPKTAPSTMIQEFIENEKRKL